MKTSIQNLAGPMSLTRCFTRQWLRGQTYLSSGVSSVDSRRLVRQESSSLTQFSHHSCPSPSSLLAKTNNQHYRVFSSISRMTNKPRIALKTTTTTNTSPTRVDIIHSNDIHDAKGATRTNAQVHTISHSPIFQTMAGVQKLATEPTREHIESIRHSLYKTKAKDESDQQISLTKENDSGIATICIRSAAKNGISGKMMCDFLDVIDELESWHEGKGVIIRGHGGFFCSGGDLVSVRDLANYEDGLKMATLMQYNLARLQALPMITMALIQGKAIGGGAEIAATTDLRSMTSSAKMGYVHCRVGIVAAWGGGTRLVQLVGPSRAIDLMSSGRLVGAEEALSMGLVNNIIDDTNVSEEDEIMAQAKRYLKSHLIGAKSTIIAIKGLVNAARTLPMEQALVAEARILGSTWGKPPHLEALNNNVKHRG